MKKRKDKLMSIYLMFGLILLVIGFSYAFFIYNKTGLYTHTITGGKMKVIYDETTGNNITIENAYPLTDKEAETKSLEFEFTITGYNESDKNIYYAIEMDHGSDITGKNRFLDTDMKLTLYENEELIFENEIFENLDNQDIHYNYFKSGTSKETPTINNYKMKLWINDYVYISDTIENDLIEWEDSEWNWFEGLYNYNYDRIDEEIYNACPDFYEGYSDECSLNDFGMNVYTSDEFANSYANFKVNVRADLTYDAIDYLTYDANGGEFTPKKTSLATNRITMQKPVMENKGFLGWSTTIDGEVEYYSGDYYSGEGKVLYAQYSDTRNVMRPFIPSEDFYDLEYGIRDIFFINDAQYSIDERYNYALENTHAIDLTLDEQGCVLGWFEEVYDEELEMIFYDFYIGSEGATYFIDCYQLFRGAGVYEIHLDNVDTSMVTDMSYMFDAAYSNNGSDTLDVSGFNTSNVINMCNMFGFSPSYGDTSIANLDLSNFDTSNVTNMSYMFGKLRSMKTLDLSSFDTSKVTNMEGMFCDTNNITNLDLSNFDTSKVTNMEGMFAGCFSLKKIDLSNFDTNNVTDMSSMFNSCSDAEYINVSSFNTSNVTNMSYMFSSCYSLIELDVSGFNTPLVTNMSSMFSNCSVAVLDVSNFDTSNVIYMSMMFDKCENVSVLDVSNFNTSKVTSMMDMFRYCSNLTSLDLTSFDVNNVTSTYRMFAGCSNLKTIYANIDWQTSVNTSSLNMFTGCTSLRGAISYISNQTTIEKANPDTGYFTRKD